MSTDVDTSTSDVATGREVPFWDAALCATIGSFFLVCADLVFNTTSAVTLRLADGAELLFPHWADTVTFETVAFVVMLLMGLSLCHVYRPRTRIGAFARGSSVILVLVSMNTGAEYLATEASALELRPATRVSTCEPRKYGPFGLGTLINRDSKGCWTTGVVRRSVQTDCLDRVSVGKQRFCRVSVNGESYWVQIDR